MKTLVPDYVRLAGLTGIVASHRGTRSDPIEVLQEAQRLSDHTSSTVRDVTTFYRYFRMEPQGDPAIHPCRGTACHVRGADRSARIPKEEPDETVTNRRFTLTAMRRGSTCGRAAAGMIDGDVRGNLDRKRINQALDPTEE